MAKAAQIVVPPSPAADVAGAVLCSVLASIGDKLGARDLLADGSKHAASVHVFADVGNASASFRASAVVTVGHGGTRVSSAAVQPSKVLGHVCELLGLAFGDDAVLEVLAAIRAKHAGSGVVDCSPEWEERADAFARDLRAQVSQPFAGSVRVALESLEWSDLGGEFKALTLGE